MFVSLGRVKIGYTDQKEGWSADNIDRKFENFGPQFFSLGQDEEYYSNIQELDPILRDNVLDSLNDIVKNEEARNHASKESVFNE